MQLKGLVRFFAIALILICLYQLSFTWIVRSHEKSMEERARAQVKANFLSPETKYTGNKELQAAYADSLVNIEKQRKQRLLDSTKDTKIGPFNLTTYQDAKDKELMLGLDLQGGMSVTMEVGLDGLIRSLANFPKDPAFNTALNNAVMRKATGNADLISLFGEEFRKVSKGAKLAPYFSTRSDNKIKVDASDDAVLNYLRAQAGDAFNSTVRILTTRIDRFGVASPTINPNAAKGIINIELAGINDPERVRRYLQSTANLQFFEVYNVGDIAEALQSADKAVSDYLKGTSASDTTVAKTDTTKKAQQPPANVDTTKTYTLSGTDTAKKTGTVKTTDSAKLEGEHVSSARQDYDEKGKPAISMNMDALGTRIWGKMTSDNVGKPIAIVLDNFVYSAPNVLNPIPNGSSQISGNFSITEAQDLADILQSGKLPAPAKIVAEQVVGPTLGQAAVAGGALSFLISFIVIFALMLIYYNTAGWVANIALILNLLFTIGILAALGFTLTAPGIAGLVLTIGMAVDTNVIIFERIKEELSRGKGYLTAVSDGYKRSYAPVLDAHVTTFLTAAILFIFGLGPVLGFATTQMLGITL